MARPVPNLDFSRLHPFRARSTLPQPHSSTSDIYCLSTPTNDSPLPPVRPQAPVIPLPAPKLNEDYMLLCRLSADGELVKVVRRHEFGPVDVAKLSRFHYKGMDRLQQRIRLSEPTMDLRSDLHQSISGRRNSQHPDTRVSTSALYSTNLLAAKRILSTTLSLEYGPDNRKIKVNSSAEDFVEYYKNRNQRKVINDIKPHLENAKIKESRTVLQGFDEWKTLKVPNRVQKLLRRINITRGKLQNKVSLRKSLLNASSDTWNRSSYFQPTHSSVSNYLPRSQSEFKGVKLHLVRKTSNFS